MKKNAEHLPFQIGLQHNRSCAHDWSSRSITLHSAKPQTNHLAHGRSTSIPPRKRGSDAEDAEAGLLPSPSRAMIHRLCLSFPTCPAGIWQLSGAAQFPAGLGVLCVRVRGSHCRVREGQEGYKATPDSRPGCFSAHLKLSLKPASSWLLEKMLQLHGAKQAGDTGWFGTLGGTFVFPTI